MTKVNFRYNNNICSSKAGMNGPIRTSLDGGSNEDRPDKILAAWSAR